MLLVDKRQCGVGGLEDGRPSSSFSNHILSLPCKNQFSMDIIRELEEILIVTRQGLNYDANKLTDQPWKQTERQTALANNGCIDVWMANHHTVDVWHLYT